jgi:hypothetical protein
MPDAFWQTSGQLSTKPRRLDFAPTSASARLALALVACAQGPEEG